MKKINNQTMRENNLRLVLNTIRKHHTISRSDLAKALELTSPAVTNIIASLLQSGLVLECGRSESAVGRRAVLLQINPKICYSMGMVITTEYVTVVLADFAAQILHRETRRINALADGAAITEILVECACSCMTHAQVPAQQILGIGIAAPGPMDARQGMLWNPPNYPSWQNIPICHILEEALGIPAVLDKETNAAAMAEYYFGMTDSISTMFMMLIFPDGIGGGILRNGAIFHGFSDGAGDIGHSLVDVNGPLCFCGQYGCLERMASGNAMLHKAKSKLKQMNNLNLPLPCSIDDLTLDDVFRFCEQGIPLFQDVVDSAAQMIAMALGNVIALISPAQIIIGGPVADLSPAFVQKIGSYIHNRSYPKHCSQIRVEPARLGADNCSLGAVMLALDRYQINLCQYADGAHGTALQE